MTAGVLIAWGGVFVIASAGLLFAAAGLVRAGDEIATRTRLGGLLVGSLLIALATSLPELVTNVSAVVSGAPDLAVGALLGSNMSNMAILAVLDLAHRRHVWRGVELGHARVASVAIALAALAVLGLATPEGITLGWIGADTLLIGGAYVAALAWMRRSPRGRDTVAGRFVVPTGIGEAAHPRDDVRSAIGRFVLASVGIVVTGPIVARAAEEIASEAGIAETFVGVTILAASTSLPELATSLGAVRIGAYDLAVGNLFGSNAINMALLVVADAAATDGPILSGADPAQVVAGVAGIGLMALALAAIVHGEETRIARLEPDAVLLLIAYAGAMLAVWSA